MKKINSKVLTIVLAILTLLSIGGVTTTIAAGGFHDADPSTEGGG